MIFKTTKYFSFLMFFVVLAAAVMTQACTTSADAGNDILYNQDGTLIWGGSPAVDGIGIVFETADTTYGAPGSRDDYSDYFSDNENQVQINADIQRTGNITNRGWGTKFPEIEFLRIELSE